MDDCLEDGEEEDVQWACDRLEEGFSCRDTEWLSPESPLDYLGMEVSEDKESIYLSMRTYILNCAEIMGLSTASYVSTPICEPIDPSSELLDADGRRLFMTGTGCLGWLANTARPDVALAHSRIAQHMAHPTQSAMRTVVRAFKYLAAHSDLCLSAPLHSRDRDLSDRFTKGEDHSDWEFFSDSDHAGNDESQNKRRSQNGFIALLNNAPVAWHSKVSSVAFAHPDISEAHADTSSGAAEIYAASNATNEIVHLSYVSDELGLPFPQPAILKVDNTTAEAFMKNSVTRSKLKHIDVRQDWVHTLRDKNIVKPEHVDTKLNLADMFTKILPPQDFIRLRDMIMTKLPSTLVRG